MPAASLPVYLGETESVEVEVFLLGVKDIYVGDTRRYYSNLLQVAALTNGGASQAAGLVSGVSFM